MSIIKKMLGIAPRLESDGSYSPSPLALKLATKSKTDYDHKVYPDAYKGGKAKVLMVCSDQRNMTMKNGKQFCTGNHPVEMLVPMLHLEQAGKAVGHQNRRQRCRSSMRPREKNARFKEREPILHYKPW